MSARRPGGLASRALVLFLLVLLLGCAAPSNATPLDDETCDAKCDDPALRPGTTRGVRASDPLVQRETALWDRYYVGVPCYPFAAYVAHRDACDAVVADWVTVKRANRARNARPAGL